MSVTPYRGAREGLVAAAAAIAGIVLACGGSGDGTAENTQAAPASATSVPAQQQTPSTTSPGTVAPTRDEPGAVRGIDSLDEVDAMSVTMTVEKLDTGETQVASYAFIRPDTFSSKVATLEVVVTGTTSYRRIGDGDWVEQTGIPPELATGAVEEALTAFTREAAIYGVLEGSRAAQAELVGMETLNGTETSVYDYNGGLVSPLSGVVQGTVRVWLGTADGRIYREEVENATNTGLGPRSRVIIEVAYDADVTIATP